MYRQIMTLACVWAGVAGLEARAESAGYQTLMDNSTTNRPYSHRENEPRPPRQAACWIRREQELAEVENGEALPFRKREEPVKDPSANNTPRKVRLDRRLCEY